MDDLNQIFGQFKNRYEQSTLCYLASKYSSLRAEDIEDIVQEAYIVLNNNLKAGKVQSLDYPYFLKICRNLCMKKITKDGGTVVVGINEDEEIFQEGLVNMSKVDQILQTSEDNDSAFSEMREMVHEALARMATKCREMLWNFYANNLSWATIAGMFELSNADTAKATANRCRKRFIEKFNEIKKERRGNVS